MPKIVDHEKRKKQIAEATWRVIQEQGMEGATVRGIAKEAELSLGSLRHYFSTQDELLTYAMNLVKEKATERINRIISQDLPLKDKVLKILLGMLPTNEGKMVEMEVWFAFTFHNRQKKESFVAHHDGIYEGIWTILENLNAYGALVDGFEIEIETEKLYAIIDGLAMHAMLAPERVNEEKMVKVLINHINSILKPEYL